MWHFWSRGREVRICARDECRGCAAALPAARPRHASAFDLQALRVDGDAMLELRRMLHERGSAETGISRLDNDRVILQLTPLFESGFLIPCDAGQPHRESATKRTRAPQDIGKFAFRGRNFVVALARDWPWAGLIGRYEVVPLQEARETLAALAGESTSSRSDQASFGEASGLLAESERRARPGEILLLREVAAHLAAAATAAQAITPSQRAPERHYIEIEVVDEFGFAVEGEAYVIVAPDQQQYTGTTDRQGRARLDDIVSGTCRVSFPRLDKDAWRAA